MAASLTPRAHSTLSSLSPHSFLQDPRVLAPLQRKTTLNLHITDQEKVSLDPQGRSSERAISEYHTRISEILPNDRPKIHATFPFAKVLDDIGKERKSLEYGVTELEDMVHSMQMERLNLYIRNMIVDFIEKICQSRGLSLSPEAGNDPSYSTTRYAQAAQRIGEKDLKDLKIAPRYYKALQNFYRYNDARNSQAHDTHIAFARLLISPRFQDKEPHQYHYWSGLFPFCYGQTVEEAAIAYDDLEDWVKKAEENDDEG